MTTIFERVKTALDTLSPVVPYALDPYKSADGSFPSTYITYLLVNAAAAEHADDAETLRDHLIQITIRCITGLAALPDVDGAMLAADFRKGPARQLPQDPSTGHYAIANDYIFVEEE